LSLLSKIKDFFRRKELQKELKKLSARIAELEQHLDADHFGIGVQPHDPLGKKEQK